MASVRDAARELLLQRLRALAVLSCDHKGVLYRDEKGGASGHFLAQETWINVKLGDALRSQLPPLRTLVDTVAHLSASAELAWQTNYHSFWKPALMDLLVCSACSASADGLPDPSQFDNFEQLMTSGHGPKFMLEFHRSPNRSKQLEVLRTFLFGGGADAMLEKEKEVEENLTTMGQQVLTKLTRRSTSLRRKCPRIELGLSLDCAELLLPSDLRALASTLEEFAAKEQSKDWTSNPVFEITTLILPPDKLLVPIEIDIVTDMIASETSTIRHLRITNALMMLSVAKRLRVFQQLLRTTIKLMWAWIALGIFHPDSEAKLGRLNLSGLRLNYEALIIFAAILRSPHPGRQLWLLEHRELPQGDDFEEIPLPVGRRLLVQLVGDTKIRESPKPRAKALEPVALESDEFEVALWLRTWVCVVVPGCGFGWAPSASIVSRREETSKCEALADAATHLQTRIDKWPLAGANVKTFDRDRVGEIDECENIKFLLRMIGHCLEGFNFSKHRMHISDTDFKEMLDACPNLTHLNLSGNLVCSLSALTERYQSKQCQIAFLSIGSDWKQAEILYQLADLIEDACSRPLRYVASSVTTDSSESLSRLASALKNNTTLRVLFFYSPNVVCSLDDLTSGVQVLCDHLTQIRADFESSRVAAALPTDRKVAFLSAIQSRSKIPSPSSSLERLDSSIVSQVFAFAGTQLPRTCWW